jgi:class 3 adenylate cyclase
MVLEDVWRGEAGGLSFVQTVTVTILITDLVGSTGLESRIGPKAADELRSEHFSLLRSAVDETGGREVKNRGDGLLIVFESASQAVSCAVAVQQRFELRNRTSDEQLSIRVGLSAGDATVTDGDYFGMSVTEAARLCDQARGGQILADQLIGHLTGGRDGHTFKAIGELALKGFPEPVNAVEVGWEPLDEQGPSLPLPPRLQEMPQGGFVGRADELRRLRKLVREAPEAECRLALISGEPGIGKTRLSIHIALEARFRGAVVLYGRSDEELALPYGPWVEALTHYMEQAPEELLRDHVDQHGGELTRLLPTLAERVAGVPSPRETDPDTERHLLFGAVVGLLCAATSNSPLVLVLDDLHWADKATLVLLKHVVSRGYGMRVLIIGTYRESDLAREHPLLELLADLHREQKVDRIGLEGLEEPDIVRIIERATGHELDEAGLGLSKQLHSETDGNPFYTGELLRHLIESGALYQRDGGQWALDGGLAGLGLPRSVHEVLGRRIDRLGQSAREALSVAAVIGRDFDLDLLLRVTEASDAELLELLEQAVAAAALIESTTVPGRFSFAHALINHALYEALGTTRRVRLHRRIGEVLEEILAGQPGARISELAYHWSKAAVDLPKAVTYACLAGERALGELAPDEAIRWFQQALELQGRRPEVDHAQRCDILIGLGEAERQAGKATFRETLLEASSLAFELDDADRAARAALANNRGVQSFFGEVDEERLVALERAVQLDRSANPGRRAVLLSLQALELQLGPNHERRRALIDTSLALARDSDDPRALANVLRNLMPATTGPDTFELNRPLVKELSALAKEVRDPALEFWATDFETFDKALYGEPGEGNFARTRALADRLGQPSLRWFALFHSACEALLRGNLAEAERFADEALAAGGGAGQPDAVMVYRTVLLPIRVYQGRAGEIVEAYELRAKEYARSPSPTRARANTRPLRRASMAWAYGWLGRTAGTQMVHAAASDRFDDVPWDQTRLTALAMFADAASLGGARDAAAVLYELLEPFGDQMVSNAASAYGHVSTYLALSAATAGWDGRADEHFALACDLQEQKGMLLWAARAHLGWAEALARRGRDAPARAEAGRALALAREHGYAAIERRAAPLAG